MENNHASILAKELNVREDHVQNVIKLIDEGNTIPFIARYRKELTGTMDDQLLRQLADRLDYLRGLDKRREEIISSIDAQGKLTDELRADIEKAVTLASLEDLYRPYKQKRRTRATVAREKGLEPLAEMIFAQDIMRGSIDEIAADFIDAEKGVESAEDAISGACDIIAENISDDAAIRSALRELFMKRALVVSKAATEEDSVYRTYYDFSEAVSKIQSHRVLAINRGEKEEFLKVAVEIDNNEALNVIRRAALKPGSITSGLVNTAIEDAWERLIYPSVEREIRSTLTDSANEQAIKMFGLNLEPLLMQPPLRNRVTLGFDPAYRTGCKIAVVDATGKVLDTTVVYPTPPHNKKAEAAATLKRLIGKHNVEAIAIGNGTASKESEIFVAEMLRDIPRVAYMMVNEAGASVYSASKLGAEEFPDYDVSLRSAVSIARRLQDPLAELVKIDPKSIGVGQYQHDMPQARLGETLTGVVENCVGRVGVDLNTASPSLLARVSGLNMTIAKNIVAYRDENGVFTDRKTLKKVAKLGPKTFVQCAGFLRIPESKNILDNTAVHPESYPAAEKLLEICGYTAKDVLGGGLARLNEKVLSLGETAVAEQCGIGVPTLRDIVTELQKPGRDPRDELPAPMLRTDVLEMKDLKPDMELTGTVRNVVDFGAFVDIGVHQDGLIHISQCADRYIRHPSEVLKVGDIVKVSVLSCEPEKKRIGLKLVQIL
ncbi:MAG: RNA-binding transcriptional accessory protein [Oscillospiraceae bacterium]|nr:RNA-binding transcriptional accessory protein [Oscillospiraceae bacterium]